MRDHPGPLLVMSAAIVVPVQLVVSGIGLERLTSGYRGEVERAEQLIPTMLSFFVIAPLIAAAMIHMLREVSMGNRPSAPQCLQAALDAFAALFVAILFMAAGIAVGLVALILPGIYLLIRWFFVAQCVVIEDQRGFDALARSGQLVRDNWWRTFAIVLVAQLVAAIPAILISVPMEAAAESADREVIGLAGDMLASIATAPFVAIVTTLLFYDLRARRERLLSGPSVP
jgi:sorbitol-specific phosphotransferase system component IIC